MPRIRFLKPSFFTDEDLSECSDSACLLFAGLWCLADRKGRLQWRPKAVKLALFPYKDRDVTALLEELEPKFAYRYEVNGETYVQVVNFAEHQRICGGEYKSKLTIPPPVTTNGTQEKRQGNTSETPVKQQGTPEYGVRSTTPGREQGVIGGMGERGERGKGHSHSFKAAGEIARAADAANPSDDRLGVSLSASPEQKRKEADHLAQVQAQIDAFKARRQGVIENAEEA